MAYRFKWFTLLAALFFVIDPLHAQEIKQPTARQLLNPDWIESQIKEIGIDKLIVKYNDYEQKEVRLVQSALDLSAHILRKHPAAVRHQLQARLVSHKQPLLKPFQKLPANKIQIVAMTPLLEQAGGPIVRFFAGHTKEIVGAGILADEKSLVTASKDGSIRIWNINNGKQTRLINTHLTIFRMTLAPDRKTLVTFHSDNLLRIWDMERMKLDHVLKIKNVKGDIRLLTISPDGRYCIAHWSIYFNKGYERMVKCWDIKAGKEVHSFSKFDEHVTQIAFFPDGKQVVLAGNRRFNFFDLTTGKLLRKMDYKRGQSRPHHVVFTADGDHLLADWLGHYEIFHIPSGKSWFFNSYIPNYVFEHLMYSIKKEKLIARYAGDSRFIWDTKTGKIEKHYQGLPADLKPLAITADGHHMIAWETKCVLKLCDLRIQKITPLPTSKVNQIYCVAISKNGKTIVTGENYDILKVWDFQNLKSMKSIYEQGIDNVCITPNGQRAVTSSDETKLWNLKNGKVIKSFKGETKRDRIYQMEIISDGTKIVAKTENGGLMTWDLATGEKRDTGDGIGPVMAFAITGDEKHIISTRGDSELTTWDINTLTPTSKIEGTEETTSSVLNIAISEDGKRILTSLKNGRVRLTHNSKLKNGGARISQLFYWHTDAVTLIEFLPGDKFILSGSGLNRSREGGQEWRSGNKLRIWNPVSNQLKTTFYLDSMFFHAILSPDGKHIIINTENGELHKLRIDNLPK